ncbi:MAG: opioid growth factor receptor-related protein [Methylorubrum rhodinum]|uniref:opioid growth factor receptor-related protein n=1 Tax=Methylorubrum rhodinum TaxID=29428 RepID=UPI003BAFD7BE
MSGPVHAFLAGHGRDGAGRLLADVLTFDDARIEGVHDFIQWCFPLREASRAVPGAPVLTPTEAEAIRIDPAAIDGLRGATARMARFYEATDGWLRPYDHNHLRITRILTALRDLIGQDAAQEFFELVMKRVQAAGSPVNPDSLTYWKRALR